MTGTAKSSYGKSLHRKERPANGRTDPSKATEVIEPTLELFETPTRRKRGPGPDLHPKDPIKSRDSHKDREYKRSRRWVTESSSSAETFLTPKIAVDSDKDHGRRKSAPKIAVDSDKDHGRRKSAPKIAVDSDKVHGRRKSPGGSHVSSDTPKK
jgi:hypothetical protein